MTDDTEARLSRLEAHEVPLIVRVAVLEAWREHHASVHDLEDLAREEAVGSIRRAHDLALATVQRAQDRALIVAVALASGAGVVGGLLGQWIARGAK